MAISKVARMGHPVLRRKCETIDPDKITDPEVQRLIRDMFETMAEYNGVGLAAPQVHQPVRLVIAGGEADEEIEDIEETEETVPEPALPKAPLFGEWRSESTLEGTHYHRKDSRRI